MKQYVKSKKKLIKEEQFKAKKNEILSATKRFLPSFDNEYTRAKYGVNTKTRTTMPTTNIS